MNRKSEAIIVAAVIGLMLIIGTSALIISNEEHEDGQEHEHEHEHEDPMEEFIHHVSNWLIWLIFGAALVVGIVLFIYFRVK